MNDWSDTWNEWLKWHLEWVIKVTQGRNDWSDTWNEWLKWHLEWMSKRDAGRNASWSKFVTCWIVFSPELTFRDDEVKSDWNCVCETGAKLCLLNWCETVLDWCETVLDWCETVRLVWNCLLDWCETVRLVWNCVRLVWNCYFHTLFCPAPT